MKKLSSLAQSVLVDIQQGRGAYHDCHGRSEHGGRQRVIMALYNRGLIDLDDEITEQGIELLKSKEKFNEFISKCKP
jgi:hypothetical protein